MLRQRLLTSSILVPVLVWEILYIGPIGLAFITGFFITIAAWEWARISGWRSQPSRILYAGFILSCLVMVWLAEQLLPYTTLILLSVACSWWLISLRWIWLFQQDGIHRLPTHTVLKASLGILILVPAWLALNVLHRNLGGELVVFLFLLVWAADSGAYFAGRYWGQQKLADKVSPGKTWEGVLGAMVTTVIIASGYVFVWDSPLRVAECAIIAGFMALSVLTVLASIVGDLLESLFKRQMGFKDSGRVLPGHGGVLDRIDSLTAAAPVFVIGIMPLLGQSFY